jgi:hypothetical protein
MNPAPPVTTALLQTGLRSGSISALSPFDASVNCRALLYPAFSQSNEASKKRDMVAMKATARVSDTGAPAQSITEVID